MKNLKLIPAFWVGIIAGLPLSSAFGQNMADVTSQVIRLADAQLRASIGDLGDGLRFPRATIPDGTWKTVPVSDWTSGFFPGCLWYMYEQTNDPYFRNSADRWTEQLKPMQFYTGNRDIGFMIFNSFGNGYRLTANPEYRKVVLQAARTAVKRFDPRVGCIKYSSAGTSSRGIVLHSVTSKPANIEVDVSLIYADYYRDCFFGQPQQLR